MPSLLKSFLTKGLGAILFLMAVCLAPYACNADNRLYLASKQYVIGFRHYYAKMNEVQNQDICIKSTFCDSKEYFADLAAVVKNHRPGRSDLKIGGEHGTDNEPLR